MRILAARTTAARLRSAWSRSSPQRAPPQIVPPSAVFSAGSPSSVAIFSEGDFLRVLRRHHRRVLWSCLVLCCRLTYHPALPVFLADPLLADEGVPDVLFGGWAGCSRRSTGRTSPFMS